MKNLKLIALTFAISLCSLQSFSQDKMGQVYFIRSLNYVGSAVPYNFYIDDELTCKIKNKNYSVHTLPVGSHSITVQNTGLGSHHISRALNINIEEGKAVYVTVVNASGLYLEEVTASSGESLLKTVVLTRQCLPKSKKK